MAKIAMIALAAGTIVSPVDGTIIHVNPDSNREEGRYSHPMVEEAEAALLEKRKLARRADVVPATIIQQPAFASPFAGAPPAAPAAAPAPAPAGDGESDGDDGEEDDGGAPAGDGLDDDDADMPPAAPAAVPASTVKAAPAKPAGKAGRATKA